MNRIGRLFSCLSVTTAVLAASQALAQGSGYPERGLAVARQICSECHAIDRAQALSPNSAAPRFEVITNVPGMTGITLSAALQTPHQTMPNVMLDADGLNDAVAYILSLSGS